MYRIFDVSLDSDIPFPELPEYNAGQSVINIRAGKNGANDNLSIKWFHDWTDSTGRVCISCGRTGNRYLLRFPELADFLISVSENRIYYFPALGIPIETLRHLLLDQVIPRILGQHGRLVIHASAVILPNGSGIAFLGNSGWGKSTLASSFISNGGYLITDDCLLINTTFSSIQGIASYHGLRLFPDSADTLFADKYNTMNVAHYTEKKRLLLDSPDIDHELNRLPINAIFLLNNPSNQMTTQIDISPLHGTSEILSLTKQMFVLDANDKQLIAKQFSNIGKLTSADLPMFHLHYPRKHSLLPYVHNAIISVLN